MSTGLAFGEVLDAADRLSPEEQLELIDILNRRLSEAGRQRIVADVREARQEFSEGRCRPITPDELSRELKT